MYSEKELTRKREHMEDFPDKPLVVTDDDFDSVSTRYPLVLIDCWASWCAPCHLMAPIIERLAREYFGKVVVGKLNADENRKTAMRFGVMALPTLLILKNGHLVDRIIGALPKARIESVMMKHI